MKKDKNFSNEHFVYIFVLIITAIFVFSPVLLYIPALNNALTFFLNQLKTEELKSSYVGAIGALIGNFLAITGALWTQKKLDSKSMEKENRLELVVVYYDLKFAYEDLKNIFGTMIIKKTGKSDKSYKLEISQKEVNKNIEKHGTEYLYIDDKWIRNVAALHSVFDESDLEKIFKMYGEINTIKKILENSQVDDYKGRINYALNEIFEVKDDNIIVLSSEYKKIISLIQKKAKIKDSYLLL